MVAKECMCSEAVAAVTSGSSFAGGHSWRGRTRGQIEVEVELHTCEREGGVGLPCCVGYTYAKSLLGLGTPTRPLIWIRRHNGGNRVESCVGSVLGARGGLCVSKTSGAESKHCC